MRRAQIGVDFDTVLQGGGNGIIAGFDALASRVISPVLDQLKIFYLEIHLQLWLVYENQLKLYSENLPKILL